VKVIKHILCEIIIKYVILYFFIYSKDRLDLFFLFEDSLFTALNALNLLQSTGKMVDVIFPVEALKERIPLLIKVITSFVEIS